MTDEATRTLRISARKLQRAFPLGPWEVCVFWSPKSTNLVLMRLAVHDEDSQVRVGPAELDLVRQLLGRWVHDATARFCMCARRRGAADSGPCRAAAHTGVGHAAQEAGRARAGGGPAGGGHTGDRARPR